MFVWIHVMLKHKNKNDWTSRFFGGGQIVCVALHLTHVMFQSYFLKFSSENQWNKETIQYYTLLWATLSLCYSGFATQNIFFKKYTKMAKQLQILLDYAIFFSKIVIFTVLNLQLWVFEITTFKNAPARVSKTMINPCFLSIISIYLYLSYEWWFEMSLIISEFFCGNLEVSLSSTGLPFMNKVSMIPFYGWTAFFHIIIGPFFCSTPLPTGICL